ncbi:MAG: sulfurtransferase [Bacteroidetes bacterium]|nr:MAG: sulfurtransferase [Bacteroidota bacterium]
MQPFTSPLISAEALLQLRPTGDVRLIDARTGPGIAERYAEAHLEGALLVDLEHQLADTSGDPVEGGRHPLPTLAAFGEVLQQLGISPESHVVVYDDKNGANAAARFWWMLRALGHEKVQVLDGGMQAALKAGFPLGSGVETPQNAGPYPATTWQLPLADIHAVEIAAQNPQATVVDVRDAYRYQGISEPIDLIAGHIPGAINMPFSANLDENGRFRSPEALRELYQPLMADKNPGQVIIHCGSGVTACHTLLALAHAGFEIPALYVGSWGEWSRTGRDVGKA